MLRIPVIMNKCACASMNEILVFFHSVKIGLVCFRKPFNAFTV